MRKLRVTMRIALKKTALLAALTCLIAASVPEHASATQEFDPLTYFVERAKEQEQKARDSTGESYHHPARSAPQQAPPAPLEVSIAMWIGIAIACIAGAVALLGWLMPPAWSLTPRIDKEIGKEFKEFVEEYGEEGEEFEREEKIRQKKRQDLPDIPEDRE
jgi:hypothetical protein